MLDPAGIPISTGVGSQTAPSAASDGSNFLVAWQAAVPERHRTLRRAHEPDRGVLDTTGIPIPSAANDQSATSVAFDGTNYLVAWQDGRSSASQDVYGARVSQAGAVLDATGVPISRQRTTSRRRASLLAARTTSSRGRTHVPAEMSTARG